MGPPWKEGEIRPEVDKIYFKHFQSSRKPTWHLAFWKKKTEAQSNGKTPKDESCNSQKDESCNSQNESEIGVADEAANSRVGSYFLASRSMHWLPVNQQE